MYTASIITQFWHDQIAEHNRQGEFLVLISFLGAFLFIRTSARLTRSVSWWPGGVETEGGVHLHHLVWGICLVLISGTLGYSLRYESPWWEVTAIGFGIGAGLTLDEFALWVYLKDVYWAEQGRKSLDAVAIATVFMALVVMGSRPFEFETGPAIAVISWIVVVLALCVICFLKERIVYGVLGMFFPIFAIVGAIRLGKPSSPFAKRRYGKRNPGKQKRSEVRFNDPDRRANRLKDKLFNAVGGAPTDELARKQQHKQARKEEAEAQQQARAEIRKRAEQT